MHIFSIFTNMMLFATFVAVVACAISGVCAVGEAALPPPASHHRHNAPPAQGSAQLPWIRASESSPYLYDDSGRMRIFHGVNHVNKGFPWYPEILLNDAYVQEMAASGVNAIRLGFMWSGAQPQEGSFNHTYYEIIATIVDKLADNGIYTLFDMHQDGFSSKFCLYDGIPLWAVNKLPPSPHPFPWPLSGDCSRPWSENELAAASGEAYQSLYNNTAGIRDDWVAFWKFTASRFANASSIIGFELINEPFAGDVYSDPLLFLPGVAGKNNLLPFYDHAVAAIREVDKRHLIFFEPVTWGMIFNGDVVGSGFDRVPGGPMYRNLSVFSFHYYCWLLEFGTNPPKLVRTVCDSGLAPQVFNAVKKDVAAIGGASFLTEFAGDTCDSQRGNASECQAILEECTRHHVSWLLWYDDDVASNGVYNWTRYGENGFNHPYVASTSGEVTSSTFDPASRTATFCFSFESATSIPTTIRYDGQHMYHHQINVKPTGIMSLRQITGTTVTVVPSQSSGTGCVTLSPMAKIA